MTKFIATGDWHVGAGLDYGATPADRLADQEAVIDQIVDLAIEHDVDALLICGDVWHRRRPTPAEYLAVVRPLRRLRAESTCDVIAIVGNHDVETADGPVALELLEDIVDVHRVPGVTHVRGAAVAMLPWTPISRLVAERGSGHPRDGLNADAAQLLIATARDLRTQIDPSSRSVLMLHWSISRSSTPTGALTDTFREVVLPAEELDALGFDVIAAGHIHKRQEPEPGIFYTSSPMPVDFGEQDAEHGVWLVDLDGHAGEAQPNYTSLSFIPLQSRRFVTVEIDLTTDRHEMLGIDETDAVAAAVATYLPIDEAVLRVRYKATEEQAPRIDWPKLRPLLDRAHKVFSISAEITRSDRARMQVDEDLAPLDALELWMTAADLNGDRGPLIDVTTGYLSDEVGR